MDRGSKILLPLSFQEPKFLSGDSKMRMILSILALVCAVVLAPTAHAALNNENSPGMLCVPLGSPSADAVVLAGALGSKGVRVLSVSLLNAAAIAASNTDYVQLELKKGSTIVAELDSRAAHENGLAQNALEPLNLVDAEKDIAASSVLSVNYNETDSGSAVALTGAVLCVHYAVK
jgi:hypothetical protein